MPGAIEIEIMDLSVAMSFSHNVNPKSKKKVI